MNLPILRAEHVKTWFPVRGLAGRPAGTVRAVDDVSLTLRQGETYGLVGETGCGKSTLGRTLIRLLEPTDGRIGLNDTEITSLTQRQLRPLRSKMQMIFQDPYSSLDGRMHVGDILTETLAIQGRASRRERMERLHRFIAFPCDRRLCAVNAQDHFRFLRRWCGFDGLRLLPPARGEQQERSEQQSNPLHQNVFARSHS